MLRLQNSGDVTARLTGNNLSVPTPFSVPPTSNFLPVLPGFGREEKERFLKGFF